MLFDMIQEDDTNGFLFVLVGDCQLSKFLPHHRAFLEGEGFRHHNVLFSPRPVPRKVISTRLSEAATSFTVSTGIIPIPAGWSARPQRSGSRC